MKTVTLLLLFALLSLPAALRADMKLKTRTSVAGHPMDSTVYIKGARQRTEMAVPMGRGSIVTIYQCDKQRMLQVNEQAKTCMITPLGEEGEGEAGAQAAPSRPPAARGQRGGVITVTTTATDTGERQKMLGYTARHVKTTMSYVAGPDSCNPGSMNVEMDGWYADFQAEALKCAGGERSAFRGMQRPGACQDRLRFKSAGTASAGYPLKVTTTMRMPQGQTMTTTHETLEISGATLDASLFDMPAGCRVVSSYQELMGMPDMAAIMSSSPRQGRRPPEQEQAPVRPAPSPPAARPQRGGVLRIGVVKIHNQAAEEVSTDSLRSRLVEDFALAHVDAVPLEAETPEEVEAEAREKGCEYILYTDVQDLKASGKLGGILGRATGRQKFESQTSFRLFLTGEDEPRLESSAASKEGTGPEESVAATLRQETRDVLEQVRKDAEERQQATPPR